MPVPADETILELLQTLNVGQYALFVYAIRKLGGELSVPSGEIEEIAMGERPQMEVISGDGPITLRLV